NRAVRCDRCGATVKTYRNPLPTTDIIIAVAEGIVLIKRKNPPYGWALPGGFIDYGERAEDAAVREAREETNLEVKIVELLGVYSDPDRDPRGHTLSVVYVAKGHGALGAGDDASEVIVVSPDNLPEQIAFDHRKIISDYYSRKMNLSD
ncbi:MAG: NUDIX domain-containing protein, partial [Desulfomonilaceae bacterium]